ncbi:hypothetical protein [Nocardia rhizosphaerihabitans]|uniref:Uncharacterized protein n=1 Tax=Nocardia rhizosphaerihabitans TaxID=1691570 RepID=A0ABQ2KV12_9NOCA|nr:hypothetical protein [Nocardia rhizosphaerihabitans]GGN92414.1 hypothetical protein GCM10011610_53450 [Nocardia rhizosphaerihabitans]
MNIDQVSGSVYHIGAVPRLVELLGVPVYTGAEEVRHAKRVYLQQITPGQMVRTLFASGGARWMSQTLRAVRGRVGTSVPTAATAHQVVIRSRSPATYVAAWRPC